MKNVERYYRWLSVEYARQCGRIHRAHQRFAHQETRHPGRHSVVNLVHAVNATGRHDDFLLGRWGHLAGLDIKLFGKHSRQ